VDRGTGVIDPVAMSFSTKVRAATPELALSLARMELARECQSKGWPAPVLKHWMVNEGGWGGRGRPPVLWSRGDGSGGSSGVREPRRDGPTVPPPAHLELNEPEADQAP
jgi:hypothetical protein